MADNVGGVITATDPDENAEMPQYSLSGADAMYFRVRDDGQIEVGASAKLDYETKPTYYMVTLTATDSFSASSSIAVTITVNDVDEAPDVSGDEEADYAENGTGAVATYTATDPEGASVSWSLGTDGQSGLFDISGGVLTFKDSPDFESPPGGVTENEYMVTIMATDETNKGATEVVTVKVTNVDEAGTVTLSALRPQSSIGFTAMLSDKDRGVTNAMWQWSKSRSRNGSYANIDDKAMSATYIPKDDDEGYFLKATAMYNDGHGSGKEASERSTYTSQRVRGDNNAPEFDDDQDPVTAEDQVDAKREVPENSDSGTFVGDPVTATDDDGDTLTYTLWDMETGGTYRRLGALLHRLGHGPDQDQGGLDHEAGDGGP